MSLPKAILDFERSQRHLQRKAKLIRAKVGLRDGTINTSRDGYIWVRPFGDSSRAVHAYNATTTAKHNEEVYVAVDPYRTEGLAPFVVVGTVGTAGTVMDALLDPKSREEEVTGAHARAHERGARNVGRDYLDIFTRAIVPLRVQAIETPEMRVRVNPGHYAFGGASNYFAGGVSNTITVPASGIRFDLVYLDCVNNTVGITTGTPATDVYTAPSVPVAAAGQIPLAYISLGASVTVINEQNIYDMRAFVANPFLEDHDHTGDSGDGGQLEADEALKATGITNGYVFTADGAGGAGWEAPAGGAAVLDYGSATASSLTSTTSTSPVDLDSMAVQITVNQGALVTVSGHAVMYASNSDRKATLIVTDGSNNQIGEKIYDLTLGSSDHFPLGPLVVDAEVASGTHTFKLRWYYTGSSTTLRALNRHIFVKASAR